MKTSLPPFLTNTWLILTEVPGWADAPFGARLRRLLPIALPIIGIVLLMTWNFGWFYPQVKAERAEHAPLIVLEDEIAVLQSVNSEQQTLELSTRATQLTADLVDPATDLKPFLALLQKEAAAKGWDATFYPGEAAPSAPGQIQPIFYLPVRVKLVAKGNNSEPYISLLALLERFSSTGKRIDLMRLAIRADEKRWLSVEANLRMASPVAHEKTTQ